MTPGKTAPPAVDVAFQPAHEVLARTGAGAVPKDEATWASEVWAVVPLNVERVRVTVDGRVV